MTFRDIWADDDFDDESGTPGTNILYVNCHMLGAALYLLPSETSRSEPGRLWQAFYCTFSYHSQNGNDPWEPGGALDWPPAFWSAFYNGANGDGLLFDHCIFIANGRPYNSHQDWIITPANNKAFLIEHEFVTGPGATVLWTMRDCEWRAKYLPSGISRANIQAVRTIGNPGSSRHVRMQRVFVAKEFADLPFDMGGMTVEHTGCTHELTGNPTPWSNAS
jgi:hypothetical protein